MLATTNPAPARPTPWGQIPMAYTNGVTVYPPLRPTPVRYKHPRSTFIVLTRAPDNFGHLH